MSDIGTIVNIGASLTGATAAETLRKEGFDGRIAMFGKEPQPPYRWLRLSKDYLAAKASSTGRWSIRRRGTRTSGSSYGWGRPSARSSQRRARSCSAMEVASPSTGS